MQIDISIIVTQMEMFAFLILAGFLIQCTRLLTDADIAHFSAFLTRVVLPCMLLTMIPNGAGREDLLKGGGIAACTILYMTFMLTASLLLSCLMGIRNTAHRRMQAIISSMGNAGFLGTPLCAAVVPGESLTVAVFVLMECVVCFGVGPFLANPETRLNPGNLKRVITPVTVFMLAGLCLVLLDIHPAGNIAWDALTAIGGTTRYFASLYIGMNIGRIGPGRIFNDWRVIFSSILKLFLFPLTLYTVIRRLGCFSTEVMTVFLIMGATPTGMSIPVMAELAGGDRDYAIAGTMLNTLLCLFSIPFVFWIAMRMP